MFDATDDRESMLTPDQVCDAMTERVGLELRLIPVDQEDGVPLVLVRWTPAALQFLARVIDAVAATPGPSKFQLAPNGVGQYHLSPTSDVGMYVEHIDSQGPDTSENEGS